MVNKLNINKANRNLFISEINDKESKFNSKYPKIVERQKTVIGVSLNPYSQYRKIVTDLSDKLEEDGLYYFANEFPYRDELELVLKDYCETQSTKAFVYQNFMYDFDITYKRLRLIKAYLSASKAAKVINEYIINAANMKIFDINLVLDQLGKLRYSDDTITQSATAVLFKEYMDKGDSFVTPCQFLLEHDRELFEKTYLKDTFMEYYPQFKELAVASDNKHQLVKKDESK